MPKGGSRKHPADCKCGNCPKMGRPKATRPVDGNLARKIKAKVHAEQLWVSLVMLECKRLGIDPETGKLLAAELKHDEKGNVISGPDYQGHFSIIPLTNLLRYLDDRDLGRPVDTVNHVHDKPLDVNVNVTLRERFKLALDKAEQRVTSSSRN